MKDEYISREAAEVAFCNYMGATSGRVALMAKQIFSRIPAADVAPVVHGAWVPSDYPGFLACSVCHDCYVNSEWPLKTKWHWCPQCGADMRMGDKP